VNSVGRGSDKRLGILASHPIQYHSPWFRHLAGRVDIEVFYGHRQDPKGQSDAGFGIAFDWDTPLLQGYPFRWLNNVSASPGLGSFGGCDTPEIRDIIRDGHFDAFLVFGWNRKSCFQAVAACKQERIPVLMRGDSQLITNRSTARTILKYIPYRCLLPRIEGHLYVGSRNREYLRHYGVPEERLFFAPHFVDNDFFIERSRLAHTTGADRAFRAKLGIPADAFVFTFVGKMLPNKRPADLIISSIDLFRLAVGSNAHVLLAGDGPVRPKLVALAAHYRDRIHFAGFVNQSEMPVLYAASNALVLPSIDETWGLVVNEAAACGVPSIVSNRVGCAADLISSKFTGATFPTANIAQLTFAMASVKETCESELHRVQAALGENVTKYSIQRATIGLEEALRAVALRRPVAA